MRGIIGKRHKLHLVPAPKNWSCDGCFCATNKVKCPQKGNEIGNFVCTVNDRDSILILREVT